MTLARRTSRQRTRTLGAPGFSAGRSVPSGALRRNPEREVQTPAQRESDESPESADACRPTIAACPAHRKQGRFAG